MPWISGLSGFVGGVAISNLDVINAQVRHDTIKDKQGLHIEVPHECVVSFGNVQLGAGAGATAPRATLQWGSGGIQHQISNLRVYGGLQIPLKGSWFRVFMQGIPGVAAPVYFGGASIALGSCLPGAVVLADSASINAGASATFNFDWTTGFIKAIRVVQNDLSTLRVNLQTATQEVYELQPAATDVWHEIVGKGNFGNPQEFVLIDNIGAAAAVVRVLGLIGQ